LFATDVKDREIIDTSGYDLRRRRRRSPTDDVSLSLQPSVGNSPDGDIMPSLTSEDYIMPSPRSPQPSLISTATNPNTVIGRLSASKTDDSDSMGEYWRGAIQQVTTDRPLGSRQRTNSDQLSGKGRIRRSIGLNENVNYYDISRDGDEVHVQKFALEDLMDRAKRLIADWTAEEKTSQRRDADVKNKDDVIMIIIRSFESVSFYFRYMDNYKSFGESVLSISCNILLKLGEAA
jgi:hypothetical protein